MKRKVNSIFIMFLIMVLITIATVSANACTGIYIGEECSEDGTTIIARSEDAHPLYNPVKLECCKSGDTLELQYKQVTNDFKWKLPKKTYNYVCAPQWECNTKVNGRFSSYALNEKGLNLTATVTGYISSKVKEADPYEKNGVAEEGITDIIGASCKSAREAVELVAKICDEKGSAESNIIMLTDKKEAWYMEIYSGHQYAAVKMPTDKIAVFGNEFMLENLEEYDDVITSPNLKSLPKKAGFAEYDTNGKLNLFNTYAGKGRLSDYANKRTWYGHHIFSPSTIGKYETKEKYPLFFKPDKKVSVSEIMNIYRSRFEGTNFDADKFKSKTSRVIGTETQQHVHIIQMYKELPDNRCSVAWECISQAECAPFVPIFSCMEDFDASYIKDNAKFIIDDDAAYSVYKELNTLCNTDRKIYKPVVKKYWQELEKHLIKTVDKAMQTSKELSDSSARKYFTNYGIKVQKSAFEDAKVLGDDVMLAMADSRDTLKTKFDYSTLTFDSQIVQPIKPKISLKTKDLATKYSIDKPSNMNYTIIVIIAGIILVALLIVIKKLRKNNKM